MWSRVAFVVRTLVVAAAGFALLLIGLRQANAIEPGAVAADSRAQTEGGDQGPSIQATERISIPYGFNVHQDLPGEGDPVVVSGVGACTDGQEITINFTVTQSSTGATATGEWNGECTGALQTWTGEGTLATASPNFAGGLAEACASAETRDGDNVTGTQGWCDPVIFTAEPLATVFVPTVTKP